MSTRVAYLLKKFPRLSETFILNEILAQEAQGNDLHIFSRRKPDDEPQHPQLARLKAVPEVLPSIKEIDPWTELFVKQEDNRLLDRVGKVAREFGAYGHPRFGSLLAEAVYLHRRCREEGIAHVHVHFATDSAVSALLLRNLGGPSYSLTMHAKDIYRSTVNKAMLDRMVADSAFGITVCDANVHFLEGMVGEVARTHLRRLYNGIDLSAFSADGGPRDDDHVLSVGRLVEKKGFDVLVRAMALLRDRGIQARATLVGNGDQQESLAALIRDLKLEDRVDLAGPQPADVVQGLMARATVFCQPCVIGQDGNRDALPTVLVESLACGLPCVSTPVTGIPEILDQGRAGVIVPEHDDKATADALERLLGDPAERERLAQAGVERAAECFDLNTISLTLKQWFDAAVASQETDACSSTA